ncbi:MAG: hypothetical protein AAB874_04190 [Patescibacteria group bacterium]
MTEIKPETKVNRIMVGTSALITIDKILPGKGVHVGSALDIAKQVLVNNSDNGVLRGGEGHYRLAMWPVDASLALKGSLTVISKEKWTHWIDLMIKMSRKIDLVPTTITKTEAHDVPWARVDNLPALVYMCDELELVDKYRADLNRLIRVYNFEYLQYGLIKMDTAGDWKDTIHRPSSAYANIFALKMLQIAEKHGLFSTITSANLEAQIEDKLWLPDGGYRDFPATNELGVDASVLDLYLNVIPKNHKAIIARLENEDIFEPFPLRTAVKDYNVTAPHLVPVLTKWTAHKYHSLTSWPHWGMMYAIALINNEMTDKAVVMYGKLSGMIEKFRTIPETINELGKLYSEFLTSEKGFTIGAGLFLELEQKIQPFIK